MSARQKQNWAAVTDIGRVRTHNEDCVLAQPPLFVVADGLGGHEAGEVASSIAVETVRDHSPRHADPNALARAVKAANREVIRAAREGIGRSGMGTTLTAALVEGTRIAIAHVGDSRAYLLEGEHLMQLTEDHSMVAEMIRRGELTEAESRVHPNRSIITRALGTDANMAADAFEVQARAGDRLLLCSDGLTGMLEDGRIAELLAAYRDPEVTAKALIAAANDAGGGDNISVVVVDIDGDDSDDPSAAASLGRAALSVLGWLLVLALVVGGIGYGVYRYAQTRYFLIAENGAVTSYRGVPGELAGFALRWPLGRRDIAVENLPPSDQQRLREGIAADSREELDRLLEEYGRLAEDAEAPDGGTGGGDPGAAPDAPQ